MQNAQNWTQVILSVSKGLTNEGSSISWRVFIEILLCVKILVVLGWKKK